MKTIALVILVSLLAVHAPAAETNAPCCRIAMTNLPPSDKSLYQLDSLWTSDQSKQVKLSVLRGRPQVLAMFFTRCEFACPILVHDLLRIEAALPGKLRGQVDFLLVSLDSARDDAAALKDFRVARKLPLANWTLLRGGSDDVRELAALLGVNFQKDARGQFAHSNLITILNAEGEIIHRQVGLNRDPADTLKVLRNTLETPSP
jgi:protein SCO1/2